MFGCFIQRYWMLFQKRNITSGTTTSEIHKFRGQKPSCAHRNYSQTRLIRTLLIHHFRLIRRGNLKTLKVLSLKQILNQPFNESPLLVRCKISAYFTNELSRSDCKCEQFACTRAESLLKFNISLRFVQRDFSCHFRLYNIPSTFKHVILS